MAHKPHAPPPKHPAPHRGTAGTVNQKATPKVASPTHSAKDATPASKPPPHRGSPDGSPPKGKRLHTGGPKTARGN